MTRTTDFRSRTHKTYRLAFWFPWLARPSPTVSRRDTRTTRNTTIAYSIAQGTDTVGGATLLYFAYNARISPDEMATAAPGAEFRFIAHLPEWGLEFPIFDQTWGGSLPAIKPEPGSTVWGAVYELTKGDLARLDEVESGEQRTSTTVEAMDRTGRRHQVMVHLLNGSTGANGNGTRRPSSKYLHLMVSGSRHWNLPVGWIAGLQEYLENGA